MTANQSFVPDSVVVETATTSETTKKPEVPKNESTAQQKTAKKSNVYKNDVTLQLPDAKSDITNSDHVSPAYSNRSCCSWSRMCDVMGNRQANFIEELRPLRAHLIKTEQYLRTFQLELERGFRTKKSAMETAKQVKRAVTEINRLSMHTELNIPPDENQVLRQMSYDLAVLGRVIEEISHQIPEISRTHSSRSLQSEAKDRANSDLELGHGPVIDEHSLKDRITRTCDTMENVIKFIDKKTERRWWLRDVINFSKLFIKLALFVSASVSVAYHEEQIAPIITLIIAIVQGIIEILDQYFILHHKPEEIKLSVMATLTAIEAKSHA